MITPVHLHRRKNRVIKMNEKEIGELRRRVRRDRSNMTEGDRFFFLSECRHDAGK